MQEQHSSDRIVVGSSAYLRNAFANLYTPTRDRQTEIIDHVQYIFVPVNYKIQAYVNGRAREWFLLNELAVKVQKLRTIKR